MIRAMGLIALFVLFAGLVFAQQADDFVKLDKDGVTYFRVAPSGAAEHTATDNANPALKVTQSGTAPSAVFTGGNVGIGIASPGKGLDVFGVIRTQSGHFSTKASNGAMVFNAGPADGANNAGFWFRKATTLGEEGQYTNLVRITDAGKVGIGTTSPSQPLDIVGNVAISGITRRIIGDFSNASHADRLAFQTSTPNSFSFASVIPSGTGTYAGWSSYSTSDPANASFFQTRITDGAACSIDSRNTGTKPVLPIVFQLAGVEKMRLDTAGNIGIGTTTPSAKLEISDSAILRTSEVVGNDRNLLFLTGTGTSSNYNLFGAIRAVIEQADPNPLKSRIEIRANSGDNSTPIAYFNSNGTVGIGASLTDYKLIVYGDSANNTGVWAVISDEALKTNIQPLAGALDKLTKLRGVCFEWKDPEKMGVAPGCKMGMIAQEVEKVMPEWVKTLADGTKTIQPEGFNAMAVEAIKELNDKVKSLEAKNADLEARLKAIEEKLK